MVSDCEHINIPYCVDFIAYDISYCAYLDSAGENEEDFEAEFNMFPSTHRFLERE